MCTMKQRHKPQTMSPYNADCGTSAESRQRSSTGKVPSASHLLHATSQVSPVPCIFAWSLSRLHVWILIVSFRPVPGLNCRSQERAKCQSSSSIIAPLRSRHASCCTLPAALRCHERSSIWFIWIAREGSIRSTKASCQVRPDAVCGAGRRCLRGVSRANRRGGLPAEEPEWLHRPVH